MCPPCYHKVFILIQVQSYGHKIDIKNNSHFFLLYRNAF